MQAQSPSYQTASRSRLITAMSRVPEVTLAFWIIKTLSTTVGETGADFLAGGLGWGMPAVAVLMLAALSGLLYLQFAHLKRYVPANYWSLVVLMSVEGTLITDILVDKAGVPLTTLSAVFTVLMAAGFYVWYRNERTLSIHAIDSGKREAYYWVVILLAFALGTGVGDLISEHFALGYANGPLLFGGAITATWVAHRVFGLNPVTAFWIAYVLTRPLGASIGDYLIQAPADGGIGMNMATVNAVFLGVIVSLVAYASVTLHKPAVVISRDPNPKPMQDDA